MRNKKAAIEGDMLVEEFMKSNKTFEEVIAFLESDMSEENENNDPPKKRGRRKRE